MNSHAGARLARRAHGAIQRGGGDRLGTPLSTPQAHTQVHPHCSRTRATCADRNATARNRVRNALATNAWDAEPATNALKCELGPVQIRTYATEEGHPLPERVGPSGGRPSTHPTELVTHTHTHTQSGHDTTLVPNDHALQADLSTRGGLLGRRSPAASRAMRQAWAHTKAR